MPLYKHTPEVTKLKQVFVPTYIVEDEIWELPENTQALFHTKILVDGVLKIEGILTEM